MRVISTHPKEGEILFGTWLNNMRLNEVWTHNELAARLGCTAAYSRMLCSGTKQPSHKMAQRIFQVWDLSVELSVESHDLYLATEWDCQFRILSNSSGRSLSGAEQSEDILLSEVLEMVGKLNRPKLQALRSLLS